MQQMNRDAIHRGRNAVGLAASDLGKISLRNGIHTEQVSGGNDAHLGSCQQLRGFGV